MPDSYRVVLSLRASSDLHVIYDSIAGQSEQNAVAMVERLLREMDGLGQLPHRYRVITATRRPARETRLMPVRPYRVYYRNH